MGDIANNLYQAAREITDIEFRLRNRELEVKQAMGILAQLELYFIQRGIDEYSDTEEGRLFHIIKEWLYS